MNHLLVKKNGYMSDYFEIYRGIRQGCLVSALLFILCELVFKIRQENELKVSMFGYKENPIKVTMTVLFLNDKIEL